MLSPVALKALLFICATCLLGVFLPSARAADPKLSLSDTAIFAIPEVWPWGYEGRYGQPAGTLVNLAHRLVAVADIPIAYELRPHRRAISELIEGKVDFAVLFQSPTVEAEAISLGTVVKTQILLTGLADAPLDLTLEGLGGESIAFVNGTYYGPAFANAMHIRKFPVRDIFQAIEMLKLGRVSAILCSDQALFNTLHSLHLKPDNFRVRVFREGQEGRLYMSKKAQHPELRESVTRALDQLRQDGELDLIFRLPK